MCELSLEGAVEKLDLKPGEVIVIKTTVALNQEQISNIHQTLAKLFPNNKALIVPNDFNISVAKEVEDE